MGPGGRPLAFRLAVDGSVRTIAGLAYVGFRHPSSRPLFPAQQRRAAARPDRPGPLAPKAEILILDEPTTFLDPRRETEVMRLLGRLASSEGKTIVVTLHDLDAAVHYAGWMVF